MKKIIIITLSVLGVAIVLGGLIFTIYLLIFAEDPEEAMRELRDAFPFGRSVEVEDRVNDTENGEGSDIPPVVIENQPLRRVSEHPIAVGGAITFERNGQTVVRYVSRGEGRMYELTMAPDRHVPLFEPNQSFLNTQMVWWGDKNSLIIGSLNESRQSEFSVIKIIEDEERSWVGTRLPDETLDVAISPDGRSFSYLARHENTRSVLYRASFSDPRASGVRIFSSPLGEWNLAWPTISRITLTSKPLAGVPGHMFSVTANGQESRHILRNIDGLTSSMSPGGRLTLLGQVGQVGPSRARLHDQQKGVISDIFVPGFTVTEKCSWISATHILCANAGPIQESGHLDSWMQGRLLFNDTGMFLQNVLGGETRVIWERSDYQFLTEQIDAFDIFLSDGLEYIFFTNRHDGYLWVYELGEPISITAETPAVADPEEKR